MYPVSSDFLEAIKSAHRIFALKLEIDTASDTFNLTEKDVDMGTLKLDEACASGNTLTLGAATAALFDVSINNRDGRYNDTRFNGGVMKPVIGLELPGGSLEWVPLGVFNIDDVSRPTTSVPLGGSDNLILLDQPFSDVSISFPTTNGLLLAAICSACGVTLSTPTFLNSGYTVQSAPTGSPSCRDIVKCIAELAAGYAQCDRATGALKIVQLQNPGCVTEANLDGNTDTLDGGNFSNYATRSIDGGVFKEPDPAVSLDTANRYDFKIDDNPVTITGVVYEADNQDYVVGDRTYALHISDNALIQGDPTDVLNSIADVMIGFAYLPFTSSWKGNPALQPGDIIQQTDRNGVSYRTIVTKSTYAYRGICNLSAAGASEIAHSFQSQQTKKMTQLLRLIHEKEVKISNVDQAVLNATSLISGALGGHWIDGDTLPDEKYHGNIFIADDADITKATKVWRWNLGGFGHSSTGVDGPYTTAITADDSIVANVLTARIITGDMIKANTITADNIVSGAVTADKIAANAITVGKIASGAVSAEKIADGAITNGKVSDGIITTTKIADGAITTGKIAANTITADKIAANAITASMIVAGILKSSDNSTFFDLDNKLLGVQSGDYRVCLRGSSGALLVQHKNSSGAWDEIGSFFGFSNSSDMPTSEVTSDFYQIGAYGNSVATASHDSSGNTIIHASKNLTIVSNMDSTSQSNELDMWTDASGQGTVGLYRANYNETDGVLIAASDATYVKYGSNSLCVDSSGVHCSNGYTFDVYIPSGDGHAAKTIHVTGGIITGQN